MGRLRRDAGPQQVRDERLAEGVKVGILALVVLILQERRLLAALVFLVIWSPNACDVGWSRAEWDQRFRTIDRRSTQRQTGHMTRFDSRPGVGPLNSARQPVAAAAARVGGQDFYTLEAARVVAERNEVSKGIVFVIMSFAGRRMAKTYEIIQQQCQSEAAFRRGSVSDSTLSFRRRIAGDSVVTIASHDSSRAGTR